MLPSGLIAKHGYTVARWGFFNGVCSGSGHLPFEQATDAIEAAVANVQRQICEVAAEIGTLADINHPVNDGTNVWDYRYVGAEFRGDSGYVWHKVSLSSAVVTYSPDCVLTHWYMTPLNPSLVERRGYNYHGDRIVNGVTQKRVENLPCDQKFETAQQVALFLNASYVRILEKKNVSRANYVIWQKDRVAKWKPAPLLERGSK